MVWKQTQQSVEEEATIEDIAAAERQVLRLERLCSIDWCLDVTHRRIYCLFLSFLVIMHQF